MAVRKLALEAGGTPRVEITSGLAWKRTEVRFDGVLLGTFADALSLQHGRDFPLPGGGELHVQLHRRMMAYELEVLHDGRALPGSDTDPMQQVKGAAGVVYFVGALSLVLGVMGQVMHSGILLRLGLGWTTTVAGVIFLVLGYLVSRRSRVALGVAIGLFALDGVWSVGMMMQSSASPPVGALLVRVFLIMGMVRGFQGMRADTKASGEPKVYR